jgi:hypothetical protein
VIGTFKSDTDADVFMAEQQIRQPGLTLETAILFGVRQASDVCSDLRERESAPEDETLTD